MHLVRFKSHTTNRHVGKVFTISTDVYAAVTMLGTVEINVIDVQWEAGIIILEPNLWTRANSFACPEIQETDLIPQEAPYLNLDRRGTVRCWISVQTHALG
jgi:hypothetical protein